MEDADLEEIRAKRLAQLQSEYRVNYEFYMVKLFY
jgi:DNA-binding TFAR19-related protein (PDSD5 family)